MKKVTNHKHKKKILTAGPSISHLEVQFVTDAVKHAWHDRGYEWVKRFEHEFAQYTGSGFTLATAGGACALELALAAIGIGPGDEVILPDMTYFGCSDVVRLVGATPVFVDILRDTWCIDPDKIIPAITKRTKAIMPVDLYGHASEMEQIQEIAKKYHLFVIEDACQGVGTLYKGRHVGAYADLAAYSFQGSKILTTSVGGMLATNSKKLYEKARMLNKHGEDPQKPFWQLEVGYEYKMSDLQAAFGLAQLKRIETFVEKKQQLYEWYRPYLQDIPGLLMNVEKPDVRSNHWMSSIVLDNDLGITRDQLRKALLERNIDTRPFFYPISMFPLYKEAHTPIAHHTGLNGINLPSGLQLTKDEVVFVAKAVRDILLHTV